MSNVKSDDRSKETKHPRRTKSTKRASLVGETTESTSQGGSSIHSASHGQLPKSAHRENGEFDLDPSELEHTKASGDQEDSKKVQRPMLSEDSRVDPFPQSSHQPPNFDYILQVHFDRNGSQYVGTVFEIPEVRVTARNRRDCLTELEEKVEDFLEMARHRRDPVPEAINSRRFPEKLEIKISQSLFRKLDALSRHERIELDNLVSELLSSSIEKRYEPKGARNRSQGHFQPQQNNNRRHHSHSHHNHRRGGGGGMPRLGGRSYTETMQNRENFIDYVRNLEKNGGSNKWNKK